MSRWEREIIEGCHWCVKVLSQGHWNLSLMSKGELSLMFRESYGWKILEQNFIRFYEQTYRKFVSRLRRFIWQTWRSYRREPYQHIKAIYISPFRWFISAFEPRYRQSWSSHYCRFIAKFKAEFGSEIASFWSRLYCRLEQI